MKIRKVIKIIISIVLMINMCAIYVYGVTTNARFYNSTDIPAVGLSVLYDEKSGYYYAYSEGESSNFYFNVMRSADMVTWENVGGVLSKNDTHWGDDRFGSPVCYYNSNTGWYFMLYTARVKSGTPSTEEIFGRKYYESGYKIGIAASKNPAGPFVNINDGMVDYYPYDVSYRNIETVMKDSITPPEQENTSVEQGTYIAMREPCLLFDNGKIYMYYTRDSYCSWTWNAASSKYIKESSICCTELTTNWWNSVDASIVPAVANNMRNANREEGDPTSVRKDGFVTVLSRNMEVQTWENVLADGEPYGRCEIENPEVITYEYDGDADGINETYYYLYYTCNGGNKNLSGIGYAVSSSPLGVFNKYNQNPVVYSVNGKTHTGYGSIVQSPSKNQYFLVYESKSSGVGSPRLTVERLNIQAAEEDTGAPVITPNLMETEKAIPSGIAPYSIKIKNPISSLTVNSRKTIKYKAANSLGAEIPMKSGNRIVATIENSEIAEIISFTDGSATIKGKTEGKTNLILKYQRRKSDGTYIDITNTANGTTNIVQRVIPIKVSDILVSDITEPVYAGEQFSFTVKTNTDVTDLKLYNESGNVVTIKSLLSETVENSKVWTVTISVATASDGRILDIFAKEESEFYDTNANVSFNVKEVSAEVISMTFGASSVVVNEPVDVIIETNSVVSSIKILNAKGMVMGKALVSKTILENGNIRWVYSIKIGTAGENRVFAAYAGINNNYNTEETASAVINVTD